MVVYNNSNGEQGTKSANLWVMPNKGPKGVNFHCSILPPESLEFAGKKRDKGILSCFGLNFPAFAAPRCQKFLC